MEGMTLQALLEQYGIHRPSELAAAADIDRRHAWQIWHGKVRIGHVVALRIFESTGIPIHELLRAGAEPKPPPRGRPPKKHPPEPPPQGEEEHGS
jgi:transcriptional regulator with XRE-family HTH domain